MTVTAKNLIQTKYASNADNPEYTVPLSTNTIIDKFTATNTDSGGAHTISVNIIPSGGSVGTTNLIITVLSVAASTCIDIAELQNQILGPGDVISIVSSAATTMVIRASGREIT